MSQILDSVCRVTIPKHMRERYGLKPGAHFDIVDNGRSIEIIPGEKKYLISERQVETLRRLYLMLEESGLLDSYYDKVLGDITRKSPEKCEKCGSTMFYNADNTSVCIKCE